MTKKDAALLAEKYSKGECSPEESAQVESWYNTLKVSDKAPATTQITASMGEVWGKLNLKTRPVVKLWPRIAAAASVLFVLSAGIYFYDHKQSAPEQHIAAARQHDIDPGKNTATLQLASGEVIALSESKTGIVIDASKLVYDDGTIVSGINMGLSEGKSERAAYHTISTPNGGQYTVVLPDGTRVWLNAGSDLKFPSSFTGLTERKVELNGEAYFEVFKNKKQPFIVRTRRQLVKVLGTHFNLNAYANESVVKTTLLEGVVSVISSGENTTENRGQILKPGQQSATSDAADIKVKAVNVSEAVAWKNGEFLFNEESLSSIMRQLERWYNVSVDYSTIPDTRYDGSISRNVKLSKVLNMLELTGNLKLKIEGNTIKVYK